MTIRKLTERGGSLTITLPKQWTKHYSLKNGNELDIVEEEEGLLIKSPHDGNSIKKISVSFLKLKEIVWQDILLVLRTNGYDEIRITVSDEQTIKKVRAFLEKQQLGYEILGQGQSTITLRSISNPGVEQFDTLYKSVFTTVTEYAKKIHAIMKNKENYTATGLLHEKSAKRIAALCKRIIIKEHKKYGSYKYSILECLENILRNITAIYKDIDELDGAVPPAIINTYEKIVTTIDALNVLYYGFTYEQYEKVKLIITQIETELKKQQSRELCWEYFLTINEQAKTILKSILAQRQ